MSSHSERVYLGDMLDYARKAHGKVAGLSIEQWKADENLTITVYYFIQTVGEAASRLPESTRDSLPHLPWREMIALRHRLVHGYGTVKAERIWEIATRDLPPLIAALEQHLAT